MSRVRMFFAILCLVMLYSCFQVLIVLPKVRESVVCKLYIQQMTNQPKKISSSGALPASRGSNPPVPGSHPPSLEKMQPRRVIRKRRKALPPAKEPRKILLLALPRTGSSITGDVISASSPEVFYAFEPSFRLHMIKNQTNETLTSAVLQALFTCNYSVALLDNLYRRFLEMNAGTFHLAKCQMLRGTRLQAGCVKAAAKVCKKYRKIVIKTIRVPIQTASHLLELYPDLVIIILVRDPRAMMLSQKITFGTLRLAALPEAARETCSLIRNTLEECQRLLKKYPRRIRFIRYERLADNPLKTFRNLFDFVQLKWTTPIKEYIVHQMGVPSAQNETKLIDQYTRNRERYTLKRSDSSAAASSWRRDIPFIFVTRVKQECADVMKLLGYRMFAFVADVRNMTLPYVGNFTYADRLPFYGLDLSS